MPKLYNKTVYKVVHYNTRKKCYESACLTPNKSLMIDYNIGKISRAHPGVCKWLFCFTDKNEAIKWCRDIQNTFKHNIFCVLRCEVKDFYKSKDIQDDALSNSLSYIEEQSSQVYTTSLRPVELVYPAEER